MANESPPVDSWDAYEAAILDASDSDGKNYRAGANTVDDVLVRLARRSSLERNRHQPRGDVVVLPGIAGSKLAELHDSKPSPLWIDVAAIASGGFSRLNCAETSAPIVVTDVIRRFYGRLVLALRAHWRVHVFPFDWRLDIDDVTDRLAAFLGERLQSRPAHLVTHSMGGLVARGLPVRHPAVWNSLAASDLGQGGRVVMLGCPHFGAYSVAQVLAGADPLVARLERLDRRHNLPELLAIIASFQSLYQLLPFHDRLPPRLTRLYEQATWAATPGVTQARLDRAYEFQSRLAASSSVDRERMISIVGVGQATVGSMTVLGPGDFEFSMVDSGDGRVPHDLAVIDAPTYYAPLPHGDLARDEAAVRSLSELLETGHSAEWSTEFTANPALSGDAGSRRDPRSTADRAALEVLDRIAARVRTSDGPPHLDESECQVAADALVHAALGARLPEGLEARVTAPAPPRPASTCRLAVGVRFGRIENFKAPVVVVGHYRGVKPVNAIGALNTALDDWIGRAVRRGMLAGQVGGVNYFRVHGSRVAADAVLVAGMGDYGRFSDVALRRLMANVAQSLVAMRVRHAGSVLIGTGEGNLSIDLALSSMLQGIAEGLVDLEAQGHSDPAEFCELSLVESDPERFFLLEAKLHEAASHAIGTSLQLDVVPASKQERDEATAEWHRRVGAGAARVSVAQPSGQSNEIRITIECDATRGEFRFSALLAKAVITSRVVPITLSMAKEIARALAGAHARAEQEKFGRLLFTYLFPDVLHPLLGGGQPVRLVVDATSAALPWEMACFREGDEQPLQWLGIDRLLTRQFRTQLSRAPEPLVPRRGQVRALVVADPATAPAWQLPGARAEGRFVARLLRGANGTRIGNTVLDITVDERVGAEECTPVELFALLMSGDYDLIHFAGHGFYQSDRPDDSGWVLDENIRLKASDVMRARRSPWLIFANACFSGAVRDGAAFPSFDEATRAASIAEAFMERGVPNYLGAGWAVSDAQAKTFADLFYASVLRNVPLGPSLRQARSTLLQESTGSTWGAYQLYGDPTDQLLTSEPPAAAP